MDWIGMQPFTLCCWGAYDLKQLRIDCGRHKIPLPVSFSRHINLKQEFADLKRIKPCGMAKALNILGMKLERTHHRAIDDVRNIAKIAMQVPPIVKKRGPANLVTGYTNSRVVFGLIACHAGEYRHLLTFCN